MSDIEPSQAQAAPDPGSDPQQASAEIMCGDWWEDQWSSPYLRARFHPAQSSARLVVRAYNPAATRQKNSLIVRVGAKVLVRSDDAGLDGWIEIDEQIPDDLLTDGWCDISLRAAKSWSPGGGDTRKMGFVIVDWRLET